MSDCKHYEFREKKYVGSNETYFYCADCFSTWGGEEGPQKRALIAAACEAEELELIEDS